MSTIALNSTLNISETVRDRGLVNPLTPTVAIWVWASECLDVKNYKWRHRMLYSCTHMATVGVKLLIQWTTNRKWHVGYQMVTWTMTSRNPKSAARKYCRLS